MSQFDADQLWVGTFKATGALVVYDPQLQVGDASNVQLYSMNARKVRDFDRQQVRVMLSAAPQPQRSMALQQYAIWKESSLEDYLALAEESKPPVASSHAIYVSPPCHVASDRSDFSAGWDSATEDPQSLNRWRIRRPPPRKERGKSSSKVILGSQAALALLGAVNPLLGVGAFIGGLLWAKSLEKEESARDKESLQRWRAERMEIYAEYLQSDTWQRKREAVIRRSQGTCENLGCTANVQEVHHKRYPQRLGDEPIDWLEGLCDRHHDERHQGKRLLDE